jgi:hypothetical protein
MTETITLESLADRAIKKAKENLESIGEVGFVVLVVKDGKVRRWALPLDNSFLNNDTVKAKVFSLLRQYVKKFKFSAVTICTEAWFTKATAKGLDIGTEMFYDLYQERGSEWMSKHGYSERSEVIICNVQNPEKSQLTRIEFLRNENEKPIYLDAEVAEYPIDSFQGRMKMYGNLSPENLQ